MRNAINSRLAIEQNQNLTFHHEKSMNYRTKESSSTTTDMPMRR